MTQEFDARRLNLNGFARDGAQLVGHEHLSHFQRLMDEAHGLGGENVLQFTVRGDSRPIGSGTEQVWLQLAVEVVLPLTCQRCLAPVEIPVTFTRAFRFVASEEQAAAEDEESEEDVLVLSPSFNVMELIEDEILMGLPIAPMHGSCPEPVKLQVADPDFADEAEEAANPFAVLLQLKKNGMR